jgi:putative redox protein
MPESRPPVVLKLAWTDNLQFGGRAGDVNIVIDGDGRTGPSPMQALAFALAGCMSADVVHVLRKARHDFGGLEAIFTGNRAGEDPHRFVAIHLQFRIAGDVPFAAIDRAIALSREKYCSVWHSMRQDIDFTVSYERTS